MQHSAITECNNKTLIVPSFVQRLEELVKTSNSTWMIPAIGWLARGTNPQHTHTHIYIYSIQTCTYMCIYIDIHIRILCFMIVIYIYVYQYYIYSNLYIYDYTCTQSIQSSHMDFYPSSFLHAWKHEEKPTDWPDTSKTCGSPSPSNRSNQFRSGEINGSPMPMTSGKQEGVSMRKLGSKKQAF